MFEKFKVGMAFSIYKIVKRVRGRKIVEREIHYWYPDNKTMLLVHKGTL